MLLKTILLGAMAALAAAFPVLPSADLSGSPGSPGSPEPFLPTVPGPVLSGSSDLSGSPASLPSPTLNPGSIWIESQKPLGGREKIDIMNEVRRTLWMFSTIMSKGDRNVIIEAIEDRLIILQSHDIFAAERKEIAMQLNRALLAMHETTRKPHLPQLYKIFAHTEHRPMYEDKSHW